MFFSKGKEQAAPTASSSTASTSAPANPTPSAASTAADTKQSPSEANWEAKGAAGLGAISSLSPECTPLKHRYDSCFNLWFKDYLAIGDDQIREQQRQSEAASNGSASAASPAPSAKAGKKKSGWFSDSSSDSSASTSATSIADSDIETRKQSIMARYDQDCGKLFKDYQACVRVS